MYLLKIYFFIIYFFLCKLNYLIFVLTILELKNYKNALELMNNAKSILLNHSQYLKK